MTIKELCSFAEVSESGYYKWINASSLRKKRLDNELQDYLLIKEIFDEKQETSGFRTIIMELLHRYGVIMNHKKVIRIMNKYGLVCRIRRVKRYGNTFEERRIENIFENHVNTTFDSTTPFDIFHTDITYIKYAYGSKTAYLSAIKDQATREIPAFEVSESLDISFVITTLENLSQKSINQNAIIHSDQGIHYTSKLYRDKLKEIGLEGSMSRRGRCVDNAPIETFFGHMKDEINFKLIETYEEVVETIKKYIYDYNNKRPQWTLKKMTPIQYRNHLLNAA